MHRKVRNSIKTALINRFYGIQTEINAYPIRMAHHANRQVQGFCYFPRKILAPEQCVISRKALAFKAFGVVQYALCIAFYQLLIAFGTEVLHFLLVAPI